MRTFCGVIPPVALFISLLSIANAQVVSHAEQTIIVTGNKATSTDTSLLHKLMNRGNYYLSKEGANKTDLDSAEDIVSIVLKMKEQLSSNEIKYRQEILLFQAHYYLACGNMQTGSKCFREIISYYQKKNDKKKEADLWMEFGKCIPYRNHDFTEEKINNYHNAALLYQQSGDSMQVLHAYNMIAEAHGTDGQLKTALEEFESLLNQYKAIHYRRLQDIYGWLAYLNKSNGQVSKALNYDIEAVKSMEATSDSIGAPMHYAHLGCTYAELGMKDKGLLYLKRSLALAIRMPGAPYVHYYLSIAVACMTKVEGPPKALSYLQNFVAQIPPAGLNQRQFVYSSYAYCYQKLGQVGKAEKYFLQYIKCMDTLFAKKQEDDYGLFMAYREICSFYVSTQQFDKASIYIKKIRQMPDGMKNSLVFSDFQRLQFKVDSASGNYLASIGHLILYKKMQDSLLSAAKSKQIEELNISYETSKKDKDLALRSKNIQLLTNQSNLQRVQVKQSQLTRNTVAGAAVLLLILLSVGYSRYRLKQQKNLLLERKQIEITDKNTKLEKLLRENEWLLREVHHRVKNNLQIVMSLLNSQAAFLKDEAALSAMLESQQRVQSMSLIHQKLYKSNNVSTINMPEYIRDMIDYLKDSFKTKNNIYFDLQVDAVDLDVLQAVPVGLILNEAITNAIKYAFPFSDDDKITITFSFSTDKKQIVLVIADNGKGLPENFNIEENKSFGMVLINGLAEDLDGGCTITSDNGTIVRLQFPCTASVAKEISFPA